MSHPFRHELSAAHARIDQLESQLAESRRRNEATLRPPARRVSMSAPLVLMVGCVFVGVGFSFSAVSRISDPEAAIREPAPRLSTVAFFQAPIITIAPKGLSAWQVGNVASRHAADLAVACGAVVDPIQLSLDLDIDADGRVARAETHGPELLAQCTEGQARYWQFPAADGPTHSTVPIYFRPALAVGASAVHVPADPSLLESGSLAVTCAPQCDAVLEDGEPIGRAPILSHPTTPGKHTLELIAGTRKRAVTAVVHAGRLTEIREDLSEPREIDR